MNLTDEFPANTNARIEYQLLANPYDKQTLDLGNLGESKKINFKSIPVRSINSDHIYKLSIALYSNDAQPKLLAFQTVEVLPKISNKIAELMDIGFL